VALGKTLNAVSHFGAKQSTRVVAQPDERHANRAASVLEWYDRLAQTKKNRRQLDWKTEKVTSLSPGRGTVTRIPKSETCLLPNPPLTQWN